MQMDLETLIKLLQNFHEELTICLENEIDGPFKTPDPILLGDFIVDAYNSYLVSAKATCDNPIVQAMPEVEKLVHVATEDDDTKRVGENPRFQKMHEVAFATKQLQTVLEGAIKAREAKSQSEIVGVMTLLENLGEQIGHTQEVIRENPQEGGQSVRHLVEEYNRYLGIVLEGTEDEVLAKMFRPLEPVVDESTSYQDKLSELRLAQSGLLSYLQKMYERSRVQQGAVREERERRREEREQRRRRKK